jgi:DNA polymerase-3 subunit alpha
VRLLPPDINRSRAGFSVERCEDGTLAIRYALAAIKKVGAAAMEAVAAERTRGGPFTSLSDFAQRIDARALNKMQLENLAAAGAFDGLAANRRQSHDAVEAILRHAARAADERVSHQASLFGEGAPLAAGGIPLPAVDEWPIMERLKREFDAVGFYLSAHPLDSYGASLRRLEAVRFGDLDAWLEGRAGSRAKVAGIVIDCRVRTSARGNRFAVAQLSDPSGVFEMTLFAEALAASRELMQPGRIVLATVETRKEADEVKLFAQKVESLEEAVARAAVGLKVYVRGADPIAGLKRVLEGEKPGRGSVKLVLDLEGRSEVEVALPGAWAIAAATRAAIKALPGVVEVEEV